MPCAHPWPRLQSFALLTVLLAFEAGAQTLTVDSSNSPYTVATATTFSQVTVASGAVLIANAPVTVTGDMLVSGKVTIDPTKYTLRLEVGGTLTIDFTGSLDVDGRGLLGGPAAGFGNAGATLDPVSLTIVSNGAGVDVGGTHASSGVRNPMPTYGSSLNPLTPGGGGSVYAVDTAGAGGGVIRLTAQRLVLNGQLRANGANGLHTASGSAGGGAGGSVNVTVTNLSGAGTLSANGGLGGNTNATGGAGRIKMSYASSTFAGAYSVRQGNGAIDGTIHIIDTTLDQLRVEGGTRVLRSGETYQSIAFGPGGSLNVTGRAAIATPLIIPKGNVVTLSSTAALDSLLIDQVDGTLQVNADVAQDAGLTVRGRMVLNAQLTVPRLDTATGSVITHDATLNTMHLVVPGTLTLVPGAQINVAGMGYPPAPGVFGASGSTIDPITGGVVSGSSQGGAGSHAGAGAGPSAAVYDTPSAPRFGGGGGGQGICGGPFYGGAGGGVIRVTAGVLQILGNVVADGYPASLGACSTPAGSGAGGTVVLTADQLMGDGGIYARGGSGLSSCVSGGGGIINVTAGDSSGFTGPISVASGVGCVAVGAPGVIVQAQRPAAPRISSLAPSRVTLGDSITYTVTATGARPMTWLIVSGPTGAQIDASGRLTWTPATAGPQAFTVGVTNSFGSDQQVFSVDVLSRPAITSTASTTGQLGVAWHYDDDDRAEATGSGPITWLSVVGPPGFTIDAATGAMQWVPPGIGTFSACIQATNLAGSAQQCFSVNVQRGPLDGGSAGAPTFRSHPSTAASCGSAWHYSGTQLPDVAGTGPFTFSVSAIEGSELPAGLTIDPSTGQLSWTPTREQKGTYPLILRVDSALGSDQQSFAVVVDCTDPMKAQVNCSSTGGGAWLLGVLVVWRARGRRKV